LVQNNIGVRYDRGGVAAAVGGGYLHAGPEGASGAAA